MSNKKVSVQVGPGFPSLLCLLFVALKLTHVINWGWLWVLSPLWIGLALAVALFVFVVAVKLIFK